MSAASILAASSVAVTTSAVRSAKSRPSLVRFRAKSLWKPPRIQTFEPPMTETYYN